MDSWAVAVLALLLIGYGAVSARLQSTPVTQAMVFVVVGLLIGNRVLDVIDVSSANEVVRRLAEATLAVVLFSDAARINVATLRREAAVPVRLLAVGLPLTIVSGTAVGLALLPGLDLWTAAALATVLAPTDAALGLPVVTNPRLPSRVRQGLNVESGLNDGICVPLLIIFLTLAEAESGEAVQPVKVMLEEIGYGAGAGVAAGLVGGWVLRRFMQREWMTSTWQQLSTLATAALAYTVAAGLGGSGFIATFVAGVVFGVVAGRRAEPAAALTEQAGELLNAVTFLLFGAVLLGPALAALDWRIAVYAVLCLTAVRMLPVAVALLGLGLSGRTVAFLGWFGPRGLASIVFVLLVVEGSGVDGASLMLTVVTCTVALSVFAHGMTAHPAANRYADWYAGHGSARDTMPESASVTDIRPRAHPVPHTARPPKAAASG